MATENVKIALKPWFMWGLSALFFSLHYCIRVSPSVITTDLMRDFGVSAVAIGNLAAAFYFPYVCGQIPFGLLSDRYGVRYPLVVFVFGAAFYTLAFSYVTTIGSAYTLRFLFGLAASAGFIGSLKLANAWLPKAWLGVAVGLTQAMGMLGGLAGTGFMGRWAHFHGWREAYLGIAILFFTLAVLIFFFLQNAPNSGIKKVSLPDETTHPGHRGLRQPALWVCFLYCGLLFSAMQVFGESWGANYFEFAHHLSKSDASSAIGMIFVGWCLGGPLTGALSGRIGRRVCMRLSAATSTVLICILLYLPMSSFWTHLFVLLFGFFSTGLVAAYTSVSELSTRKNAGLSIAIANMFTILIGATLSPFVGWLLDRFWHQHPAWLNSIPSYAMNDYHLTFSMLPLCLFLAFILTFFMPETLKRTELTTP